MKAVVVAKVGSIQRPRGAVALLNPGWERAESDSSALLSAQLSAQLSSAELGEGGGETVSKGETGLGSHEDTIAYDGAQRDPVVLTML